MTRILTFYKSLVVEDKVNDIEIYLQNFRSYLYKANQAMIVINEIFNDSVNYRSGQIKNN